MFFPHYPNCMVVDLFQVAGLDLNGRGGSKCYNWCPVKWTTVKRLIFRSWLFFIQVEQMSTYSDILEYQHF